jgi:hypothetical protein
MALGYDKPLYILAFDHRGSFQKKFFGVTGEPNEEETTRISDAKRVIYEGARRALDEGVEAEAAGVLVDEQFGADIARDAKTAGRRSSTSSTTRTSARTSSRSTRTSPRYWSATTSRATGR